MSDRTERLTDLAITARKLQEAYDNLPLHIPGPQSLEQYDKAHGQQCEYGCPKGDKHQWGEVVACLSTGQCERQCLLCDQCQHTFRYCDGIWLDGPMLDLAEYAKESHVRYMAGRVLEPF